MLFSAFCSTGQRAAVTKAVRPEGADMAVSKRLGAVFVSGLLLGAAAVARARKQLDSAAPPLPPPRLNPLQPVAPPSTARTPRPLPEFDVGPDEPAPGVWPAKAAAPKSRFLILFALLFVLAALALVGAWFGLGPNFLPANDRFAASAVPPGSMTQAATPLLSACPLQPAVAPAGEKDGQFPLQADVSGLTATDIGSFLVIGKQSAAAGRPRDAETAFLMACRVADKIKGAGSIESADARYQLGVHYAAFALAVGAPAGAHQAELLQRAEGLYADSLPAFVAKYGASGDPSRQASQGLSAVRQALAQPAARPVPGEPAVEAPTTGSTGLVTQAAGGAAASPVQPPPSDPRKAQKAKGDEDMPQGVPQSGTLKGNGSSFDCRRARSATEKMICSDAELSRLDRELGRAYERARNASSDPSAFRRQGELEWRRRETMCQDRGCLLRWYVYRRAQLVGVIDGRGQAPTEELR